MEVNTPDPVPATSWTPSFWQITLIAVVVIEALIGVEYLQARAAYQADMRGACLDECLGTWITMVFWIALLIVWPIVSLAAAAMLRGIVWLWRRR